jgi:probable selenium-dependent hydroxylase accessory protein YqeC
MDLARALRLIPHPAQYAQTWRSASIRREALRENVHVIAFVGAGGKTTAIFHLARSLSSAAGNPVIVTATSHLAVWQFQLADHHRTIITTEDLDVLPDSGITLITGAPDGDRSLPLPLELLTRLRDLCLARGIDLLIEADGSRSRPLKAPAGHEPPIPEFADIVVVVAGLSGLNRPLTDQVVHRLECFTAISGLSNGDSISPDALVHVLLAPRRRPENIPSTARRVALQSSR